MRTLTILLFCLSVASLRAQDNIAEKVYTFAADPELRGAQIGVDVVDVSRGKRVASFQPYNALIPASTLKLMTTAAAFDVLGPGYRFTTILGTVGVVVNGTLRGDVYIIGGGDPTLGSPYMAGVDRLPAVIEAWAAAIQRAGIRRIEGRIIGDGSYYGSDGAAADWPWSDLGNYYGAGAYGLNLHENSYQLDLLQRKTLDAPPIVQGTRPAVPKLEFTNELLSGPAGSGDQAYIYAAPFSHRATIRGSIPVGSKRFTIRGSIPDPALFAAEQLQAALGAKGIRTTLPPETDRTVGGGRFKITQVLHQRESPPLLDIIRRTNERSLNLYAEALLREVAKARGEKLSDLSDGRATVDWLRSLGIDTGAAHIIDGSGLAPRNFFTPATMTAFLVTQAGNDRWRSTLAVAGRTGSMRNFLKERTAEGRLAAKSGSLHAVRCYAGYARGPDGRDLAFAIMVNNYTMDGRKLKNKMLELMNDFCERPLQ